MYEEKIDALLLKLKELPALSKPSYERLLRDFAVTYTYNSNAIEGSTLTERETYLVLNDGVGVDGKPMRFQLDAVGHKKAFGFVCEKAEQRAELDADFIKRIHAHVLCAEPEAAGKYRDVPVHIGGTDAQLATPASIPAAMENLLAAYYGDMQNLHITQRVARFHLRFENIHPFIDGNGRTGRLLLNFELMKDGFPPIDIKFADRARYYDCFRSYEKEDEMPMVYLVQEYLLKTLDERVKQMEIAAQINQTQR